MNGFLKAAANCFIMKCLHQRHSETLQMATSAFRNSLLMAPAAFRIIGIIIKCFCFIEAALKQISKLPKDQEVKNEENKP